MFELPKNHQGQPVKPQPLTDAELERLSADSFCMRTIQNLIGDRHIGTSPLLRSFGRNAAELGVRV